MHQQWFYLQGPSWMPFPAEIEAQIEASFLTGSSLVSIGGFEVNLLNMNLKSGEIVKRDKVNPTPAFLWEWYHQDGWIPYNYSDCDQLSIVSQNGLNRTVLCLGEGSPYLIDCINMRQVNLSTGGVRSIRKSNFVRPPQPPPAPTINNQISYDDVDVVINAASTMESNLSKCSVCLEYFNEECGFALKLQECSGHGFHHNCIRSALLVNGKCPLCGHFYLDKPGNQPDGQMNVDTYEPNAIPLEGFESYGTIIIRYDFPSGIQGANHPNPGTPYTGTYREAYLPDTPEGREVLGLLRRSFDMRHTFTVGTSVTTNRSNTVIWNGIHHKTNPSGGPAYFGYPDPTYFNRVKDELRARNIF